MKMSDTMKSADSREEDAAHLAAIVCSDSNANQVSRVLQETGQQQVQELATTILRHSGHTLLHVLAQRGKLPALRALLPHGLDMQARNAQGATALHVALSHHALPAAKVLLEHGANPSEVVSRHKGTTLLHLMVTCARPRAVALLLDEKADANCRDLQGRTPFHLAAVYGHADIAAILLRHEPCDVNAVDASGHTGVMLAILNNNQDLARQLVDCPRVDIVRRRHTDNTSCLHLAVSLGQLDVARCLLRRNTANINGKERRMGRTPIHLACALRCGPDGVVSSSCLLLPDDDDHDSGEEDVVLNGQVPDPTDSAGPRDSDVTADCVDDVLRANVPSVSLLSPESAHSTASPHASQHKGTVLYSPRVLGNGHSDSPRLLVNGHSDRPNLLVNGHSDRMLVNGNCDSPRLLTARTPRAKTPRWNNAPTALLTPRQHILKDHNGPPARSAESTPRRKTRTGTAVHARPLHQTRHSISGEPLARAGASLARPQQACFLASPLHVQHGPSGRSRRPSTAPAPNPHRLSAAPTSTSRLPTPTLTFRIPPGSGGSTSRDNTAWHRDSAAVVTVVTPLNVASVRCKLVNLLLDQGADASLMTTFRKSPLHITSIMGAADVMALLLPHVTNINVLSAGNRTALHLAVEGGHAGMVSQLVQAGANLALRDISGMTSLHLAARLGRADIVSLLLRARAEVNSCDFRQRMPLHHACLGRHYPVIDLLLKAGACLDRVDDDGFSPLDYTTDRRHESQQLATPDNIAEQGDQAASTLEDAESLGAREESKRQQERSHTQRRRKVGVIYPVGGLTMPSEVQERQ